MIKKATNPWVFISKLQQGLLNEQVLCYDLGKFMVLLPCLALAGFTPREKREKVFLPLIEMKCENY